MRWALQINRSLPEAKRLRVFMPGTDELDGEPLEQLRLNPFEPAAARGEKIDVLSRCENLSALLVASLPGVTDVMPALIDETVYAHAQSFFGDEFESGKISRRDVYPRLDEMLRTAEVLLKNMNYAQPVHNNLSAALRTRLKYLIRGTRGNLLNVDKSTDYEALFSAPAVINLSRIAGAKDKALIMAILLLSMYEYRASVYAADAQYRLKAQGNKLLHLTLVEEAHNLLSAPPAVLNDSGNPQQVVADLFSNILSEIRGYGEGMMIVDQIPSRLIPDVVKNTNYKICHRLTSPDDCELMAACLGLRPDQRSILQALEVRNALVCGDEDDAAAWVRIKDMGGR